MRRLSSSEKRVYGVIGARIAIALDAAEMTQAKMAKLLGISQSLVSQIIAGGKSPKPYLHQIAKHCRVPVAFLERGESKQKIRGIVTHRPKAARLIPVTDELLALLGTQSQTAIELPEAAIRMLSKSIETRTAIRANNPPWKDASPPMRAIVFFIPYGP